MGVYGEVNGNHLKWAVFYAKVVDEKELGSYISGVYFGGIGQTKDDADELACQCSAVTKGCIVIPKIFPLPQNTTLPSLTQKVRQRYDELERDMFDIEEMMLKGN